MNAIQSYNRYKKFSHTTDTKNFTAKNKTPPLQEKVYCYILKLKADYQGSEIPFRVSKWIGPYLEQNFPPNGNYIVRNVTTNKIQSLHRTLLRKYTTDTPLEDSYTN